LLALYAKFHVSWPADSFEDLEKMRLKWEEWARREFQYLSWIGIDLTDPEERKHHEENVELWKRFTSISIAETEKKLDLLNVHATYNIGESFYEWLGLPRPNGEDYPDLEYTMKDIVKELIEKWVATQNEDGSVGVVFPEEMKMPSCILQKKDGTGLYLTSDLAAIKYRLTNGWNPSKIIYSVDVRQQLHLKQAFTIAKMAWPELTKDVEFTHAWNGFIKLKEWAMSTRHGTVIFLEALIEEWNERTGKILEEKWRVGDKALDPDDIQAITVGAIKYSYLAQDREKDVTFDWDKALNFEWNSGPYIQYAYVRAQKIVAECEIRKVWNKSLISILSRFESIVSTVAESYKPHHLALYAYDVAGVFNSFYVHTPKILEESDENLKHFRLSLVSETARVLKQSFFLLGIHMPTEM
jgi:arginyl-tRNA synthetase